MKHSQFITKGVVAKLKNTITKKGDYMYFTQENTQKITQGVPMFLKSSVINAWSYIVKCFMRLKNYFNSISTLKESTQTDKEAIIIVKKPRKTRSDKGVKRSGCKPKGFHFRKECIRTYKNGMSVYVKSAWVRKDLFNMSFSSMEMAA